MRFLGPSPRCWFLLNRQYRNESRFRRSEETSVKKGGMKHPSGRQIRFRHSFDHPPIAKTELELRAVEKKRLERDMIEIERVHTELRHYLVGGTYKPSSTTTTPFFVKARGERGVRNGCSYSRDSRLRIRRL
ncbi:hypothetical protein CDAR_569041 [Caerostris darwini]|uniref:Uncharacterized protein n=1 Tax=Caerostris darwini TaxID=1538125 RepID=A0AAV4QA37_9ARAC|nr:hypothetical protein CDAR_569041 [Caerostris darwini]